MWRAGLRTTKSGNPFPKRSTARWWGGRRSALSPPDAHGITCCERGYPPRHLGDRNTGDRCAALGRGGSPGRRRGGRGGPAQARAALADSARMVLARPTDARTSGRPLEGQFATRCATSPPVRSSRTPLSTRSIANPHVWEPVHRLLGDVSKSYCYPPLDYLSLVHVMKRAYLVPDRLRRSARGGTGLGVPVWVLREVTRTTEGGRCADRENRGTERAKVVAETIDCWKTVNAYVRMARGRESLRGRTGGPAHCRLGCSRTRPSSRRPHGATRRVRRRTARSVTGFGEGRRPQPVRVSQRWEVLTERVRSTLMAVGNTKSTFSAPPRRGPRVVDAADWDRADAQTGSSCWRVLEGPVRRAAVQSVLGALAPAAVARLSDRRAHRQRPSPIAPGASRRSALGHTGHSYLVENYDRDGTRIREAAHGALDPPTAGGRAGVEFRCARRAGPRVGRGEENAARLAQAG